MNLFINIYLVKMLLENIRDWKILVFVLIFAPCFVLVIHEVGGI